MRYGLNGSIQENVAAIPPMPARRENTGVIQHSEATMAANNPALALFEEVFEVLMIPLFFHSV